MTKREIRRAARLLALWADAVHKAEVTVATGVVEDARMAAEIAEHRDLSRKLYALARERPPRALL